MTRPATLDPGAAWRCSYRTVLDFDPAADATAHQPVDDTTQRRFDAAGDHRATVAASLIELHAPRAVDAGRDVDATLAALDGGGLTLIVHPALPRDEAAHRHGAPSALICDQPGGGWRPLDVHNHFLTSQGASSLPAASLETPWFMSRAPRSGVRLRKGGAWRRDMLRLAHHHRMLEALGIAAPGSPHGAVVDRGATVWWLALAAPVDSRGSALAQYDTRFAERVALLEATIAAADGGQRPGAPWWHRECEECPYEASCRAELAATDDVSLVRFTDANAQEFLRAHGITTRRALAALDLADVERGRVTADEPSEPGTPVAVSIGRALKDADRLVRRARVEVAGSLLRLVDGAAITAHRRDVEIDIDMESYGQATYLWGALVTSRIATSGIEDGYRGFVEWGELTSEAEGALFARFYAWLAATVATARTAGRTVAVYCFWAHAERGQMRRAMATGVEGLPASEDLDDLLGEGSASFIDLHRVVTSQLQTAGQAGLKVVATHAGFSWRDEAPSGEASMGWYEAAIGDDAAAAAAARTRILEYNEDDCAATRALRDWLDGPARALPHIEGARPVEP